MSYSAVVTKDAQAKKKRPEGRFWLQILKDQKACLMPTAKVVPDFSLLAFSLDNTV
jgi:hypothetical protein